MNSKQYNNVIDWTLKHEESAQAGDSLNTIRAIFKNMGVALPGGDCKQVSEILKTNNFMGWAACTPEKALESANKGVAAICINDNSIAVVAAMDEEEPVSENAAVMFMSENTTNYTNENMAFYSYCNGKSTDYTVDEPEIEYHDWQYYADLVVEYAKSFLGMSEAEVEDATGFALSDGLWCVDFVRLCCKLAGVYDTDYTDIIPTTSGTSYMRNEFRDRYLGTYHVGVEGIQPGDIAFTSQSATASEPSHTCIAISGVRSDGTVETINGNWGSSDPRVRIHTTPSASSIIGWYAHPDYEKANDR